MENQLNEYLRKWAISQGLDAEKLNTPAGRQMVLDEIARVTKGTPLTDTGFTPGGTINRQDLVETTDSTGTQLKVDPSTGYYATYSKPVDITGVNVVPHSIMPGAPSYPSVGGVIIRDNDGRQFEMSPDGHLTPYVPQNELPSIHAPVERSVGRTIGDFLTKAGVETVRGVLSAKDALFGPPENPLIELPNDPRSIRANVSPYFTNVSPGENALYAKMGVVPNGMENETPLYGYKPWMPEATIVNQSKKYGGAMGQLGTGLVSRGMDSYGNNHIPTYGPNGLNQPSVTQLFDINQGDNPLYAGLKSAGNQTVGLLDFITSPLAIGVTTGSQAVGAMNELAAASKTAPYGYSSGAPVSGFSPLNSVIQGTRAANTPGMLRLANGLNLAVQGDFALGLGGHALSSAANVWKNTLGSGTDVEQPVYTPYSAEWYQQLGQQMEALGRSDLQTPYSSINVKSGAQAASSAVDAGLSGLFAHQIGTHTLQSDSVPNFIKPREQGELAKVNEKKLLDSLLNNQGGPITAREQQILNASADAQFLGEDRVPEGAHVLEAIPRKDGKGMEAVPFKSEQELMDKTAGVEPVLGDADRARIRQEYEDFKRQIENTDLSMNPANLLAASGSRRVGGVGRDIKPKEVAKPEGDKASPLGVPVEGAVPATKQAQVESRAPGMEINAAAAQGTPKAPVEQRIKELQDQLKAMVTDPNAADEDIRATREALKAAVAERSASPSQPAPVAPTVESTASTPAAPAGPTPTLADVTAEAMPKPKPKAKPKAPEPTTPVAPDVSATAEAAGTPTPGSERVPQKQVFFQDAVLPPQTDADRAIYGDIPKSIPVPPGNEGKNYKFMVYDRQTKATQWIEADNPMNFKQVRDRALEQYGDSAVVVPMRRIVNADVKVTDRNVRSESPYEQRQRIEKKKGERIPEDQRPPQIPPREAPKRDAAALLEQVKDPRRLSYDEVVQLAEQGNQVAKDELASRQRQMSGDKAERRAKRLDGLKPEVESSETLKQRIAETPDQIRALEAEVVELNKHAVKMNIRAKTPEGQKQMADPKNFPNGRTPEMVRREIERKRNAWSAAKSELNARTRQQQGWEDVRGKKTLKSNQPDLTPADRPGPEGKAPSAATPAGFRDSDMPRISGEHALRQHKGEIGRLTTDQLVEVKQALQKKGHTEKDKSEEGKTLRKINNALDRRALKAKVDEQLMSHEDLKMRKESIPKELEAERLKLAKGIATLSGPEKSEIISKIKDLQDEQVRVNDELSYRKRKESARRSTYGEGNPSAKEGTVSVPEKSPSGEKDKLPKPDPRAEAEARRAEEAARAAKEAADKKAADDAAEAQRVESERKAAEEQAQREEESRRQEDERRRQEEERRRDEEQPEEDEFTSTVTEHTDNLEGIDNFSQAVQKRMFGTKKNAGLLQKIREATDAYDAAKTPSEKRAAMDSVREHLSELESIRDELQEKHDNTPESLQETEAYYNREEAISALEDAISGIQETLDAHEPKDGYGDPVSNAMPSKAKPRVRISPGQIINDIRNSFDKRGGSVISNGLRDALGKYYEKTGIKLEVRMHFSDKDGDFDVYLVEPGSDRHVASATFAVETNGDVYVARLDTSHDFRHNGFATGLIAEGLRSTGEEMVKSGMDRITKAYLHDASDGGASERALSNVVGPVKVEEGNSEEVSNEVAGRFDPTRQYSRKGASEGGESFGSRKGLTDRQRWAEHEAKFQGLSYENRRVVDRILKGGANVSEVLKEIHATFGHEKDSPNGKFARYAKFLLDNADAHSLSAVVRAQTREQSVMDGDDGSSYYSSAFTRSLKEEFPRSRGRVTISQTHLILDPIKVIMHEVTHAVTAEKIDRALSGFSTTFKNAGNTGTAYLDHVRAFVKSDSSDPGVRRLARAYLKYLENADRTKPINSKSIEHESLAADYIGVAPEDTNTVVYNKQYGGINLHEFAAECMTNAEFQRQLSEIKFSEGKSILQVFKDAVAQILGIDSSTANGTLLREAMESTMDLSSLKREDILKPGQEMYDNLMQERRQRYLRNGMSEEQASIEAEKDLYLRQDNGRDIYDRMRKVRNAERNYTDVTADLLAAKKRDTSGMDAYELSKHNREIASLEAEKDVMEEKFRMSRVGEPYAEAVQSLQEIGRNDATHDDVMAEIDRMRGISENGDYDARRTQRDRKRFFKGKTDAQIDAEMQEAQERSNDRSQEEEAARREADRIASSGEWEEQSDLDPDSYQNPVTNKSFGRVLKEEVRAHQNAVEDLGRFVKSLDSNQDPRSFTRKWGNRAVDFSTISLLQAAQGQLLKVAERYESHATMEINGLLNGTLAGRTESTADLGFHGEVGTNTIKFSNRVADAIRQYEGELKGLSTGEQRALLETIGREMTKDGLPSDPKLAKVVSEFRQIYKDLFYYQKRAGVKLDWAGDFYLPRMLDNAKVLADRDGFINAAQKAYEASGMDPIEAFGAAAQWYDNILLGDHGFSYSEGGQFIFDSGNMNGEPKHTRSRVFDRYADSILDKYYNRNILDVTQQYVGRAVRNAELTRRFGDDFGKYQALQKRIIHDEGNGKILREVNDNVAAQLGAYGGGGTMKNIANIVNSYTAISMLPRATFSSLTEPIVMAIRSGRMTDVFNAYRHSMVQFGRQLAALPPDYRTKLAEDIGVVAAHAVNGFTSSSITQRFMGDSVNTAAGRITSGFFRRTGLHQFTEGTRVAAVAMGETFIRRLARDIDEDTSIRASSTRYLRELGVKDVNAFAAFVKSLDGLDEQSRLKRITGNNAGVSKAQREYRNALVKFAEQTIMNPNAGTRPRWAAHPIGQMAYNLQSYLGAFHENVTKRVMRNTGAIATDPTLTMTDRVRMLGPIATFPVLAAAAYYLNNDVREKLFTDPSRRFDEPDSVGMKQLRALSRSNILGRFDALVNLATSVKYDKDPATALLGPGLGIMSEGFKGARDYFSDSNSKNTNTAERRAHRLLWDIAIRPPLNALMSVGGVGRVGSLVGAVGIQATSHPALRESYVERMAGPPVDPKNRPPPRNFLDDLEGR